MAKAHDTIIKTKIKMKTNNIFKKPIQYINK